MTAEDEAIHAEYHRNTSPASDGALGTGTAKLDIDTACLDLELKMPLALSEVGLADSGIRSGPKAAYLVALAVAGLGATLAACETTPATEIKRTEFQRCLGAAQTQNDINECHWAKNRPKK